ncbi:ATP-binding cassette, subfamily B [Carnobacterium iners]|uniref:ATP-binding cassette, subfamily B n=1 Tax=Carnobacterium iners TaxID=1073423 RepID=A0A1X7N0X9_9LACT|nr:ABC transporter ATP-binding protein [Carnobacterium iners]SEK19385.1 ATP-binding cassette, subfamily B [Carnobacterium iners]SMH30006.1 ATP-binding cassette, subfamily B [Carnobacterium iners]
MTTQKQTAFSTKESGQVLLTLMRFAKPHKFLFIVSFVFLALSSSVAAYLPIIIQRYIDTYLSKGTATMEITIRVVTFYGVLTILKAASSYGKDFLFNTASERTVGNIRNSLYEKVGSLGMRYFDQTPAGTVVSRVTNDTETIKEFWTVFLNISNGLFSVIAITVAMFALNWRMALVFLLFIPFIFWMAGVYRKKSTLIYSQMRMVLGQLNASLSESISGMSIIQKYHQEKNFIAEFDEINQEYVASRRSMYSMNALLLAPAIHVIEALALVMVLLIFGYQDWSSNAVDIGLVYAFTAYSRSFFQPISQMMNSLSSLQDGIVAGHRVQELLESDELAPQSIQEKNELITNGHIQVKNLSFSYDGKKQVLRNISFEVEPGQTVALVGQTGSGKSSIINVLMRFYEYNQGEITIDGHSLKDMSIEGLRSEMGLVLQDSFLFYGNIADNIRMYDASYTDEEVKHAAEFVYADDFISEMEQGYASKVIERGASLSAGEKQLISFARTILRSPRILILDEATANIDTETEGKIQKGLANMRKNRTSLIIAHRLSTIKDANKIIVLNNGEIVEQGSHDELINKKGAYFDMYELQTYQERTGDF